MSYTAPKGVVFDESSPCGACLGCTLRTTIKQWVDDVINTTEPEIEIARKQWSNALDAERREILPHGSSAEEWREEVVELVKARDAKLARIIGTHSIPPCSSLRLKPRIAYDINEVED